MPTDSAQNIRDARVLVAGRLGITLRDGTPGSLAALSQADQVRLLDGLAEFIAANPTDFTPQQVALARQRVTQSSFGQPLADDSLGASLGDFAGEFAGGVERKLTLFIAVALVALIAGNLIASRLSRPA